jgi:folate-binding protein YgfZ
MTDPISDQARALSDSAGLRARDDLVLVRVRGEERRDWLNGQVTNDVRDARPGHGVYALAVTVRGKIMADLWVLDRGDELAVLLPQSARDHVCESFERQIIMEDVELAHAPELRVLSVQGPRAAQAVADLGLETHVCDELGHGGVFVLLEPAAYDAAFARVRDAVERADGSVIDDAAFELARLRAGRARFGKDFGEQNYPQEAGLKQLAVSFNKGCYLGQEVVCTLESRGRLSRELVRLEAPAGAQVHGGSELRDAQDHVVGVVTSAALDPDGPRMLALGYVKAAHATPDSALRANDATLRVVAKSGA